MRSNKLNLYSKIIFFAFLIFAVFTRFYRLGVAPESLIIDEAHHGYIAHSLAETGRDEHGESWPLVFKGFGDYKLPLYPYLLMPLVKIFGLNNFIVRLPSAIAGLLIVLGIYLLFLEWGFRKKIAFLAALITLCSPWSFILSRFAYESNLALTAFIWALYFFFKAENKKQSIFLINGAILLAMTNYAYVAYKIISPMFVVFLLTYYALKNGNWRQLIFKFLLPFSFLILPLFIGQENNANLARFKQVGFLSDPQLVLEVHDKRNLCLKDYSQVFCYLTWNKYSLLSRNLVTKLVELYSPGYLFLSGDAGLYYLNVERTGQFLIILLPFYLLGIFYFFEQIFRKDGELKDLLSLLFLALIITPLPAILSDIQKVRLSALLPFLILLIVGGYLLLEKKLKKIPLWFDGGIVLGILIFFSIYFVNFTSIHVRARDYFYDVFAKSIFNELLSMEDNYDEIVIDDFFSDPIMYLAYYHQINPRFYQENVILGDLEASGFQHAIGLGKYRVARADEEITEVACGAAIENKEILYVANVANFVEEKKENDFLIKIIRSSSGALDYAFIYDTLKYGQSLVLQNRCQ